MDQQMQTKKSKKWIGILIGCILGVGGIAGGIVAYLLNSKVTMEYVVNPEPQVLADAVEAPAGMKAFGCEELGIAFLYTCSIPPRYEVDNKVYMFMAADSSVPYISISVDTRGNVDPANILESYKKSMKNSNANLEFDEIAQVNVNGKKLYMLRAEDNNSGQKTTYDKYVEMYPRFNIQYEMVTNHIDVDEPYLYDVINTMRFNSEAYYEIDNAPDLTQVVTMTNENVGLTMDALADMEQIEVPIGVMAMNDNLIVFASYQNTDVYGAAIYGCEDFVKRCQDIPELMVTQIGLDTLSLSAPSSIEQVNNTFNVCEYTITGSLGDFQGKGSLLVIDRGAGGCYIAYYLVADGAHEDYATFGHDSVNLATYALPVSKKYTDITSNSGIHVLTCFEELGDGYMPMDDGIILYPMEYNEVLIQYTDLTLDQLVENRINTINEFIADSADEGEDAPDANVQVGSAQSVEGGRCSFEMNTVSYVYMDNTFVTTYYVTTAPNGRNVYVEYTANADDLAKFDTVIGDILWSLKFD